MQNELTLAWWLAAVVLCTTVVTTGLVAAVVCRRAGSARSAAAEPALPPPSPEPVEADSLTEGLIGAYDLAGPCPAVRAHIQQVLRRVGVVQIDVEPGAPFDPALHLAVETEPAGPGQADRVARQVRPGWSRRGTVVRPGEVVVWTRS